MNKITLKHLGFLTVLLLIISIIVNPLGEFCLYDDWSFSYSLKTFIETGKIKLSDWTSMPLITQILWGSLFTLFTGFSFTALKISTIVMGFIGIWGTYFLFLEITNDNKKSLWYSIIFLIQPVFLNFVYSFNTDVPFYTLVVWGAYFLIRFLKNSYMLDYIVGLIILLFAILLRDIGIALAIAFGITYIYKNGISKKNIIYSLIPILLGILAIILWRKYLISVDSLPALYDDGRERMLKLMSIGFLKTALNFLKNFIWFFSYFGVFLSPLFILNYSKIKSELPKNKYFLISIILFSCLLIISGIATDKIAVKFSELLIFQIFGFAYWENVHAVSNGSFIHISRAWNIFSLILGSIGFAIIVMMTIAILKICLRDFNFKDLKLNNQNNYLVVFFLFSILIYALPILLAGIYVKYLIFLFPFLILLIDFAFKDFKIELIKKNYTVLVLGGIILYFSIATSHDLLTEEKTLWEMASKLNVEQNIPPNKIDAGITYSGWHLYKHEYVSTKNKNWWWIQDDEYLILDGDVKNYKKIDSVSIYRYLPPGKKVTLYTLKRENSQ